MLFRVGWRGRKGNAGTFSNFPPAHFYFRACTLSSCHECQYREVMGPGDVFALIRAGLPC